MHRQRFGYAAVFGWSPPGHEQGAALNHPSQPRGRALMHDVPGSRVCKVRRQHAPWRLGKGLRATTKLRRRSPSLTRSSTVIGIFPGFPSKTPMR